jgi:hypothetical protein
VVLQQDGQTRVPGVSAMLGSLSSGLGDIGVSGKLAMLREDVSGVSVAAIAGVTLPTGRADYRGQHGVTFTPAVAVSRSLGSVTVAGNFGWRMRRERTMADLRIDDELVLELGAAYRVDPVVALELGWSEATLATSPFGAGPSSSCPSMAPFCGNQSHGEALGGATFRFGAAVIEAIIGVGVQHGYGTPDWRGVLAVRYGG